MSQCKKCGTTLNGRSDSKMDIGLCGSCFNKKECIKCGRRIGNGNSGDDTNKSLCAHCK